MTTLRSGPTDGNSYTAAPAVRSCRSGGPSGLRRLRGRANSAPGLISGRAHSIVKV